MKEGNFPAPVLSLPIGMRRFAICTAAALQLHVAIAAGAVFLAGRAQGAPAETVIEIDPSPPLAGTLVDIPGDDDHEADEVRGGDRAETAAAHAPPAPPTPAAVDPRAPGAHPRPASAANANAAAPKNASSSGPSSTEAHTAGLFGAVGDRSAADLATAFTRGFPQAASTDPQWTSTALGNAGSADVVITLDDGGHVASTEIRGAPTAALRSGITRTMALIGRRAFTSHGRVTTLHLTSKVSKDEVHDGLHGEVFAIGASFTGAGDAFFALAIGRRIDLHISAR